MRAPVHVSALPRGGAGVPLAVDVVRWRIGGKLHLTVVAKATLSLVHQGTARLEAPAELVRRDRHWDLDPARSVEAASDLAPYRARADVTLFGHAYNPPGRPRPATSVRLGIFGQRPLLVKTVQVFGDRVGRGPAAIRPFQQLPLVYERAQKSADNPLGIDSPNLVNPDDRTQPVAFGPVPSYWLQRRRALGALAREALEADVVDLPEGFDWSFFQAAPPDQQIPYLVGDEWIVLDGMHPVLPRFQSRLPSAVVAARVHGAGAGPGYPVEMVADGLIIDADRQACAVTWRRSFPVDSEEVAASLRILVGLALPDERLAWPDLPARAPSAFEPPPPVEERAAASPEPAAGETRIVDLASLGVGGLPFMEADFAPAARAAPAHPATMGAEPPNPRAAPARESGETAIFSAASLLAALPFLSGGGDGGAREAPQTPLPNPSGAGAAPPESRPSATLRDAPERPAIIDDDTTTDASPRMAQALPFVRRASPPAEVPPPPAAVAPPPASRPRLDFPIPDDEGTAEFSLEKLTRARLPFGPAPATPFSPPANPAPPPAHAVPSGLPFAAPSGLPFSAPSGPPAGAPSGLPFSAPSGPPAGAPSGLPFSAPAGLPFTAPPAPVPPSPASWPGIAPPPPGSWPGEAPTPAAPARPVRPAARPAPGAQALTRPPPRATPDVPVTNPTPLVLHTLPWQVKPPQDVLVVVVKATFDLDADGPARLRKASDPPVGDLHLEDDEQKSVVYPSDFAIFKPKADVTLSGHACAPGGLAPAARVTFRFGSGTNRFDRSVNVFGDRRWKPGLVASGVTDPAPFKQVPLVWERAFGGPRFEKNPVGTGHAAAQGKGAEAGAALPNLEDPAKGITAPGDTPDPVCFAPLSAGWKERWSKLGTYDARWLKTRWPFFPEDFDWAHFQSAPAAQRLEHLKGDEPFEIVGAHPAHPAIRGRLPGLRPRCFLHRTEEAGGAFEEVVLKLDTAAFDTDAMKVNLVWRGVIEVSEDEAPELAALFLMTEEAGEKAATLAQARERFLGALAPRAPVAAEPEDEVTAAANDVGDAGRAARDEDVAAALAADGERREAVLAAALAGAGMADAPAGAPPPPPDPQAIAETLRKGGASDEDVARLMEALRPEEPASAPPEEARARVERKLAAGESFEGEDLAGVDLAALDFSGRKLAGANLKGARLAAAVLHRADLSGAQLAGADLTDANLGEANLAGADLQGAMLARANLAGAGVPQANFGAAEAEAACFWGARGGQASFDGARLANADFREAELPAADFSGAELGGAVFEKALMESVRLFGAKAAGAKFDHAKMPGARADGGVFPAGSFKGMEAPESVWERADLTGATLTGAQLAGAGFSRIKGHGVNFSGADLKEAKFRRAKLEASRFLKTNLMSATFERADLTNADLRGANLHGAETLNARLVGARLDLAIVTKTKLKGRS